MFNLAYFEVLFTLFFKQMLRTNKQLYLVYIDIYFQYLFIFIFYTFYIKISLIKTFFNEINLNLNFHKNALESDSCRLDS